jgi:HSP20 family molecular chaperone IbpA
VAATGAHRASIEDTDEQDEQDVSAALKEREANHHVTHSLVKERTLGKLKRAFYFYVDVDRNTMTAYLRNGVLEITIPKRDGQHKEEHSEIKVEPHPEPSAPSKDK